MNKYEKTDYMSPAEGFPAPQSTGGSDAISRQLRSFYDAVQEEQLPDRLMSLLEQLSDAEQNQVASSER
ncbi:NepR family anti-sigma factor [Rhizobium halophytocola]|uniref:Anti-sigma factor NepR domain-containing protein n=1 Tax=Rhizobium halophytocola TaxID=735519 RepID=A0ABS4E0H6_9HYPH|nr:NepR family anti-sigma factor [Rhizobium halophytocola]MBP1851435.1 hypothetical protein [Rhizobium halophytocola]